MFDALAAARNVIVHVREPLERIARRDPDLARQLRRAATSVPFNTGDGLRMAMNIVQYALTH